MSSRERQRHNDDAFQRIARFFIQFVMICLFHCAIYLYTYNTVDSCFIRFSGLLLLLLLSLVLFPVSFENACMCIAGIFHEPQFNSIFIASFPSSIKSVLYTFLPSTLYCHLFCTFFLFVTHSLSLFISQSVHCKIEAIRKCVSPKVVKSHNVIRLNIFEMV